LNTSVRAGFEPFRGVGLAHGTAQNRREYMTDLPSPQRAEFFDLPVLAAASPVSPIRPFGDALLGSLMIALQILWYYYCRRGR